MVFVLSLINIVLAAFGIYRSFKKNNIVIFIWLVLTYFALTSFISLDSCENSYIMDKTKFLFVANNLYCLIGFTLSDIVFNRKQAKLVSMEFLTFTGNRFFFQLLELIYWVSLIGTFLILSKLNYNKYNTGVGGGWFQIIYQSTSCILLYYAVNKQWVKILISFIMVTLIVSIIGVRSLMYFVVLPLAIYYIYNIMCNSDGVVNLVKRFVPVLIIATILVFIVNSLRFGEVKLPETELTNISLIVIDSSSYHELYYFNSVLHYFTPLLNPFINAVNTIIGENLPTANSLLPPSIPILNAVVIQGVSDASDLQNAAHMPATIYHDLLFSWGSYAGLAAFFLYWYMLKVSTWFQKNSISFFVFSGIFGWHFFMLCRGAVDGCTSGLGYSIIICFFLYVIVKKYTFHN